jgi:hypothetical protein
MVSEKQHLYNIIKAASSLIVVSSRSGCCNLFLYLTSKENIGDLQQVRNNIARVIRKTRRRCHINQILAELKLTNAGYCQNRPRATYILPEFRSCNLAKTLPTSRHSALNLQNCDSDFLPWNKIRLFCGPESSVSTRNDLPSVAADPF